MTLCANSIIHSIIKEFELLLNIHNIYRESESEKRNDSVLTDGEEDSIASRMKRKRRRNRQPEADDDENNSYEY